jgi:putative transposase
MSLQTKLLNTLILHQILLEHGLINLKLDILEQVKLVKDSTILKTLIESSQPTLEKTILQKSFVMQEFLHHTKKKILIDKLNYSKKTTPMQKSYQTLDQVSTSNVKVLKPFWKEFTQNLSTNLWLPIKTDCVGLDVKSSNGSYSNLILNSWFSSKIQKKIEQKNSQMTYCPSLMYSLQGIMEDDQDCIKNKEIKLKKTPKNIDKQPAQKAIKIRLYPNKEQKTKLREFFGITRFIYNACLADLKKSTEGKLNKKYLRSKHVNNENYKTINSWMLNYHYDIRDEAMNDCLKNYNSNIAKYKIDKKPFSINFKSKKNKCDSIAVLAKHWNYSRGLLSDIFTSSMNASKKLPKKLNYDSRLIKNNLNQYFLCIPKPLEMKQLGCEKQTPKIISLDPGVRTFITGYDPNYKTLELSYNDIGKIGRLLHYKKKLQKFSKYSIRKAFRRINMKIYNLVDDCHKKLAKYICSNYNYVLIPKLNFHNFKNLNKSAKNKMIAWRHCDFVKRLQNKSREYNTKVIVVEEDYTSMTCTNCGCINNNLGSSKDFNCSNCNINIDRDINGSRNILLKYITERVLD